jgi:putative DeoR family transcriptional regulator (stage III sporulation protein D)
MIFLGGDGMDSVIRERTLLGARFLLLERSTVREVAKRIGCSKSTVHKDLSERLKDIDFRLYQQVQELFEYNQQVKHIRGGESTKQRYSKKK